MLFPFIKFNRSELCIKFGAIFMIRRYLDNRILCGSTMCQSALSHRSMPPIYASACFVLDRPFHHPWTILAVGRFRTHFRWCSLSNEFFIFSLFLTICQETYRTVTLSVPQIFKKTVNSIGNYASWHIRRLHLRMTLKIKDIYWFAITTRTPD